MKVSREWTTVVKYTRGCFFALAPNYLGRLATKLVAGGHRSSRFFLD